MFVGASGRPWQIVEFYGILWHVTDSNGFNGFYLSFMEFYGVLWIVKDFQLFLWIAMDCYGLFWNFDGLLWILRN